MATVFCGTLLFTKKMSASDSSIFYNKRVSSGGRKNTFDFTYSEILKIRSRDFFSDYGLNFALSLTPHEFPDLTIGHVQPHQFTGS